MVTGLGLEPGDIVRIYTGNGGGFGDPKKRSKELIENDLLNEYVTKDQAKKYFGYKK